jgi:PTH1 family peptidyl-tRNA hydrolase
MLWRRTSQPLRVERLIVGLGNPGAQYAATRHNVGIEAVAVLAQRHRIRLRRSRLRAAEGIGEIAGMPVALVQPHTYMNLSGRCVIRALRLYGIGLEKMLVICDDLNLAPGKIRLRRAGSAGGHNGLASVIQAVGSDQFARLRLGIGSPPPWQDGVDYVLEPFAREELESIGEAIQRAADAAEAWVAEGIEAAMNRFNA